MTVSTTENFTNYLADGIVDTFSFSFQAQNIPDMFGLIDAINDPNITVLLNADQDNNPGGTVKFNTAPPPSGSTVTVLRRVSITQEVDYQEYDPFPAETHEGALDKLTMEVQQLAEEVSRAPKSPIDSGIVDYDLGKPIAEKLIIYKADESGQISSGFTAQELMDESGGDIVSATPPPNPNVGDGWWDTAAGKAFIWYDDGGSQQWVERIPVPQSSDVFDAKLDGYQADGFHADSPADLDTILLNSKYATVTTGLVNAPDDFVEAGRGFIETTMNGGTFGSQVLYGRAGDNAGRIWMRNLSSGTWSAWKLVVDNAEGSWSPILSDSSANDAVQSLTYGRYKRDGRMVTAWGQIICTSVAGITGTVRIKGLPFDSALEPDAQYTFNFANAVGLALNAAGQGISGLMPPDRNHFTIRRWNDAGGSNALNDGQLTNTAAFVFSGSYLTDEV